jgi:hypothetical protein
MSEQDAKKLQEIRHNIKSGRGSVITDARSKLDKYQSQDLELTIRLRESTINKLKTLSWSLYQRKEGGTYDEIVIHLIKSFDECRNHHYNKGKNI